MASFWQQVTGWFGGSSPTAEAPPEVDGKLEPPMDTAAPEAAFEDPAPDLTAHLQQQPDDRDAWLVYADRLEAVGDPRASLVQAKYCQQLALDEQMRLQKKLLSECRNGVLGAELGVLTERGYPELQMWNCGFLTSARVMFAYDMRGDLGSIANQLNALFVSPASRFLRSLGLGLLYEEADMDLDEVLEAMRQLGPQPQVRMLTVGDFVYPDEMEISWISWPDVTPLFACFPNLRELTIRGACHAAPDIRSTALTRLVFESGGLDGDVVAGLGDLASDTLETLKVWFGEENYGGIADVAPAERLLANTSLPALRTLGLMNCEIANDVVAALSRSPLLKQITTLNLSMGTLTDEGARVLLSAGFGHLGSIDVSRNFLTDGLLSELRDAFGDRLVSSEQKDDGEEYLYCDVGE
jgi:uncharacterized protein (TIGR02996 family)